ncbi:MAG: GAF domain-containing protein, partial [Chloroflexi bacterium]|nr:GAF domain-containing protein [Chloroflexota bacterium]
EMAVHAIMVAALATAGLLMLYAPFRTWVDSFIERVFLPERYSLQALIYSISQAGNRLRLPGELGDDLLRELMNALQVTQAHLFIKHESGPTYHRIAGSAAERSIADITFQIDSPLMRELAQYRLAMHADRLQELPRLRALWIGEWDALQNLQAEVLVPILVADNLIGFLILGKKTGNEPYTRQELQQTLPLLANQISIALSNSQLYAQEQRRANQLAQTNITLRQAQADLNESAESIRREAARAGALARIADRLNAQLDLATVLAAVCEEPARALYVPAACVTLYPAKADALEYAAGYGLPQAELARQCAMPRALFDRYVRGNGAMVINAGTPAARELLDANLIVELNVQTCVATSMMREGQLVGSLNIYALGSQRHFSDDELDLLKGVAAQAAQAIVNARLYDDAQRRLRNVEALRHVDASITGSVDLYQTLRVILDTVKSQLGIDAADVMLLDEPDHVLEYAEGCGFRQPPLRRLVVEDDRECAAEVVRTRQMVAVPDLAENPILECRTPFPGENFRAYVGMPLVIKDELKGVLEIFQRGTLDMGSEWLSFLNALCAQAAIAIDNSDLFANLQYSNQELSQAYESTLEGWARALELRDHETQGHTRRVASMSARLARAIGVAEEDIVHIRRGAILHDIGKMAIPDSILLKPGPLSEEEWRIMRLHPVHAYRMLSSITFLRRALDIPYSHHEKWDGTGYPLGLKGDDIPLWARIFAIVDVWDALLSDRPYHRAWSEPDVRAYLSEQSGRHFDPHIVKTFLAILDGERTPVM